VATDHFLENLRCPQDRTPLSRASAELVARINRAITAGSLSNRAGGRVERPIDGALVREAGDLLYPIIDGIPVMLPDEAIEAAKI
jgi:uncharacterized protein YbaR (Trm112 family)